MQTVGSAKEARAAVNAGADIIIGQGIEAGGHVWGQIGGLALIPSIVDAVPGVTVLAAGGIAHGRGLAAAVCMGASGVMLGSRFVMSTEANAHPAYQRAIAEACETDAVYLTDLFDGGWKNAPHRALGNSTYREWLRAHKPQPGYRPLEGEAVATCSDGRKIARYSNDAPTRDVASGQPEAMALYVGQGVGMLNHVQPAADIVLNLIKEAESALQNAGWNVLRENEHADT